MRSFPFREHRLDLDGLRYAYVDEGTGPPVLLVHGNPTWAFFYRELLHALPAAGYRALAPDHIGMGRSAKPPRSAYQHTLDRRIADLARFIDALGLTEPLTLVVHDWGGPIGLGWAVRHPQLVARLVLLNTAAFPLPAGRRLPLPLRAARTPLGALAVLHGNAFTRGATRLAVRHRMPAEVRQHYLAPYAEPADRVAVLEFVRDIPLRPGDPAYDALARTAAGLAQFRDRPVLICWGMRDFVFDARILRTWIERYPHAEVHRFPDAGHYLLEDAGPQVSGLVVEFLRRTQGWARAG